MCVNMVKILGVQEVFPTKKLLGKISIAEVSCKCGYHAILQGKIAHSVCAMFEDAKR